uniref:Ribonuclease H-like domain-containing protein n=1 Tax=Tanacetum cinerariifolium TaxID=118510 RepID=A0A6L2P4D6_TANCI|nr:ribonuclease H-like domain-containing protein [Tanacetum cinerariifolium]
MRLCKKALNLLKKGLLIQGEAEEASIGRRSLLDHKIQQLSKGSSEGFGIISEFLDEPKDNYEVVKKQARNVQTSLTLSSSKLKIQSIVDVPIHQEYPSIQRTSLIDIVISMVTDKIASTPIPPTTQAQVPHLLERQFKIISIALDNLLVSVEVLRYDIKRIKSENKGIVPTEMELVLEETQQVFGKHLEEKHVSWAGFVKKQDKNTTLGLSERGDSEILPDLATRAIETPLSYSKEQCGASAIRHHQVNPAKRHTIDHLADGKLHDKIVKETWELIENLALYDHESWNDPIDLTKFVKAISLPQDVPRSYVNLIPLYLFKTLNIRIFEGTENVLRSYTYNLKGIWESKDLIEKKIDWKKPLKEGDGAWHIRIEMIDLDGEKFNRLFQSILTTRKLSKKEKPSLEYVEARLLVYKKNESVYEEDIMVLKREIHLREVANTEIVDKCKTSLRYNAIPPPYTGNFMPPKPDLSFSGLEEFVNEPIVSEPTVKKPIVETSEAKASAEKPKVFWTTAKAKTINEKGPLQSLVDGKKILITASTVFLNKQLEGMLTYNRIYVTPSHTKKIFGNMRRVGKDFSKRETPLFPTMMVQAQEEMGEDESVNKEMNDSLVRAATTTSSLEVEQDSGVNTPRSDEDSLKLKELMELCLGEDASKQRRISDINADEGITLVSTHDDDEIFDVDKDLSVTTAATTPTISIDEVTLAQALAELKHTKPKAKAKGIVFHEPEESTTTTTIPKPKSQDKGKAKMIEEPVKLKKKDQIQLDEEVAMKLQAGLQAKFDKEQRLTGVRAQQEGEANIALIESEKEEVLCSKESRIKEKQTTNTSSTKKNHVYLPQEYGRKEAHRFEEQKTGKKITINGSDTAGYDKTMVECFNCHKMGHFARECRSLKKQESRPRNQDSLRNTVIVEDTNSKAMVAIDGAGFDWSYMADDEVLTNMALMAFSDSKMILEPDDSNREVPMNETFHVQTDDELTKKELKQIKADDQANQTILLGLPEDIYAAVDNYETAQKIRL